MNLANEAGRTLHQTPLKLALDQSIRTAPFYLCKVPAGFPSPANDYMEDELDLNVFLVQHKSATFFFRVQGDSMREAGILDGDIVAVDRSLEPQHGLIVIAVVNGECTIKRLHKSRSGIELRAENPNYPPIAIAADTQLEVWGVVCGVVRRYPA
ncbi:translesion error-prone DNA polymerase V autoproteolytic subunit [Undibacterium luofuense]|jgi:DNA polymerase V|uniref:LexA family protein n=1 Tax=Undibacterium luofuense TaxID=2828733 RepID=UPI0030EBFA7C